MPREFVPEGGKRRATIPRRDDLDEGLRPLLGLPRRTLTRGRHRDPLDLGKRLDESRDISEPTRKLAEAIRRNGHVPAAVIDLDPV
jgi:hypothetical protein